jgi:hypothetical protein
MLVAIEISITFVVIGRIIPALPPEAYKRMKLKEFSTFDRIVGIIGLVVAIPAFLEFFSKRIVNGLLLIIIMLLVGGYLLLRELSAERKRREVREHTLFTYVEVEKVFVFSPNQSNRPQIVKHTNKLRARANHPGPTHIWFRNIAADGECKNFQIDGVLVPEALIRKKAGSYEVGKEFAHPLARGEECHVILTYDIVDSFLGSREGVTHTVFTETENLKMRVEFANKIGRNAEFFAEIGGGIPKKLTPPRTLNNGSILEVEMSDLQVGGYYTVEWVW